MLYSLQQGQESNREMISIVIPFYNEENNVGFVLEELLHSMHESGFLFEIIPVNNGSSDGTAKILEKYESNDSVRPVSVADNQGLAFGAYQGFLKARGEWICFFCGDGQTNPRDVVRMYQAVMWNRNINFITGYRVKREDGFVRNIISKVFNRSFSWLFKTRVRDINGTPKMIKSDFIKRIRLRSKGWFLDAELLLHAKANEINIYECPVIYRQRRSGKSHVNILAILEFIGEMAYYYWRLTLKSKS